ncbi:MAG: hypothetical protein RJA22_1604 [Verrucomicrobiota bacterium]
MKRTLVLASCLFACTVLSAAEAPPDPVRTVSLFDGRTLAGWEGDPKIWRVEDGALTGGSLTETVKRNEFLASTRDYTNFIIRFQIRLLGSNGFINSGFQIRSQRVPNNSEMIGYQCDYGEPGWYGAIYDESRRNKLMASSDMKALRPVLKVNGWNDYVIRADGARITTWINGVQGVDYVEADTGLPNFDWGKFGIQVHGGGKAVVQVRNVTLEELPATPPGKIFRGAPAPRKAAVHNDANRAAVQTAGKAQPLAPEEERALFTVAPGFVIELVAAEDLEAGYGKFVAVDWDTRGNLWTMTALEYPVDANESPAVAKELYASRAKDKVLVHARDPRSPTGYAAKPRVFADGLAIPLGILPYRDGVYVQHGPDIVFLRDTDGDGKADKREVVLTGFGVQDSHLFPHQFTRAPGNWLWFAQGAFNYGKVKTTRGKEVQFDQTRMARFRPDGSDFDITSQGPCNIWGLHLTMEGETWIQEANDYGYPAMPFHEYANYPGCSQAQWKSYAPEFPGTAPHFAMGGTGLSGLAMTDATGWPEAYAGVIYIANPITRKIQAIQPRREGGRYAINKLPDFIQSSDEMFRPVALRLGPDGCLYVVDWYNKIISHNEVPRNHPERDKKRGRIWRVRPADFRPLDVPDFTTLPPEQLLAKLGGPSTVQSHLAWQAIGDRGLRELAPRLRALLADKAQASGRRVAALWALEALRALEAPVVSGLWRDADRHVRREAVRAAGELGLSPYRLVGNTGLQRDPEPEVRAEVLRTAGRALAAADASTPAGRTLAQEALRVLINAFDLAPLDAPTMKSTQSGKPIKVGPAYDREFERYLVRLFLERQPRQVGEFLAFDSQSRSFENTVLATLALEPRAGAAQLAKALPRLTRPPNQEELLRLAQFPDEPGAGAALQQVLKNPASSTGAIEALLKVRTKLDAAKVTPLLTDAARQLLAQGGAAPLELGIRLANAFQLASVEPDLARVVEQGWGPAAKPGADRLRPDALAALGALKELKSDRVDLFARIAREGGAADQQAALAALAAARNPDGPRQLAGLYPSLPAAARRTALAALTGTKPGAAALVQSVRQGTIPRDDLDGAALDKLQAVLGDDRELAALLQDMATLFRPALRLDGKDASYVNANLTLAGPFTVECWVRLEGEISNRDGILGAPDVIDINFANGLFRVWVAGGQHDVVIARKKAVPGAWTHYAVTRDAKGIFRIYVNGELDATGDKASPAAFAGVDIGRTIPKDAGTDGWLTEYRVWDRARTAAEIRADFDRSLAGEPTPKGLVHFFPGAGPWGKLQGGAKVVKTTDFPALLTAAEAKAIAAKFEQFHGLAEQGGDVAKGQALFRSVCQGCHSVAGQGGQIGPVLNGAGALGVEALLRNILTPNAAMEPGYRAYRVELKDGDVLDGLLVSQDKDAIVLRRQNTEDLRIPQADVKRAGHTRSSLMPEGLLEPLPPKDVSDLFAYLKTLR